MGVNKTVVISDKAPVALGPYSHANSYGNFIFTAGQLGINPISGELVPGGVEQETRQAITNLIHILEAAGSSLDFVLKTTVFLRDINDFSVMNSAYSDFFKSNYPGRTTVQVVALPKNGAVEIEAIAIAVPERKQD